MHHMSRFVASAVMTSFLGTSALAQTATATGTGIAASRSTSASRATAISGQGGAGGTGVGTVTVNTTNPITPAATATTTTVNNTGTSTIRNVPTEFAPGLTAAGLETCLGSVSGGGAFVGTGFSFGSTIPDPGCAARLDARTLWSFGLKKAAVARLCLNGDIYAAMPDVCSVYLPRPQPTGLAAIFVPTPVAVGTVQPIGGPVEVVIARTGQHRLCNDYDEIKRRCRAWAH